ncbi:MAG: PGPGW domain-containing protein [Gemmatimonadota bacterium]
MNGLPRLLRRIAVTVAGTVIIAVGAVLLVAPGPGLLVILLGLVVLGAEYEWARRRLDAVRARARSAADKAAASRVATATTILFGAGAIGLGGVLIFTDLLPVSGVGTGAGVVIGGLTVLATLAYSIRELRRARRSGEPAERQ